MADDGIAVVACEKNQIVVASQERRGIRQPGPRRPSKVGSDQVMAASVGSDQLVGRRDDLGKIAVCSDLDAAGHARTIAVHCLVLRDVRTALTETVTHGSAQW